MGIAYHRGTLFYFCIENKYSGYQATLFSHIITHNNLDSNSAFRYPRVSSLRFEQFSHQTQNLGRAQGVTRHKKGTNSATIHHLNK